MKRFSGELREHEAAANRRQIVLERELYCQQFALSRVFIEEIRNPKKFLEEHAYRLTLMVMASPLRNYGVPLPDFSYPRDWWEAFKARWFPKWALKRWPVKLAHVGGGRKELEVRAIFPELAALRDRYRIEYCVSEIGAYPEQP